MANPNFIPTFSTNEVWRDLDANRCLTDDLDTIESNISDLETAVGDKADADHSHTEYALTAHGHEDYAVTNHSHTEYASVNHSHTDKADLVDGKVPASQLPSYVDDVIDGTLMSATVFNDINGETIVPESGKIYNDTSNSKSYRWSGTQFVVLNEGVVLGETAATAYRGDYGKIAYEHSQTEGVHVTDAEKAAWNNKAAGDHAHSGYASSSHTHTASEVGAAASDHSHSEYATASHSHSGYASSSHTHSGYAESGHSHDEYFPVEGGTINGETNVAGVLRVQGQQAFYYATGTNSQTIGTNNATGGTTICCGPNATAAINGTYLKTATILPRATGTYTCGNANFRWAGIYSTAAVNVSSDERMKRDICAFDDARLAEFIDKLDVVSYNYNTDEEDAKARIGLIAQEVRMADSEIAEFFVDTDENDMLQLRPADLVFPLISAVQQLSKRVAELEGVANFA